MKYYIIAGEASGDLYGARLIEELKVLDDAAEFLFWGGDGMAAVAGTPVRHISDLAIMGFVEVVRHLGTVLRNMDYCKEDIRRFAPDVVVGIDYPGFNLKIESWAHKQGYKTIHYISPNLWAWKKNRIKGMRRSLDRLCYILPFEQPFFETNKMPQAVYVGHPLLDVIRRQDGGAGEDDRGRKTIALLPGSRRQELENSLPTMVALAQRHREYQFVVAGMSLLGEDIYRRYIPQECNIDIVYDSTYRILSTAYAAVVCSGTATLETALFGVPQVVCYRANPISVAIAKTVVSRRIRYISLVNLIADSTIVTELIQEDFSIERLEQEFALITTDQTARATMQEGYAHVKTLLGDGGASRRTAQIIRECMQ